MAIVDATIAIPFGACWEAAVWAQHREKPVHALRKDLDRPLDCDVLVCAEDVAAAKAALNK